MMKTYDMTQVEFEKKWRVCCEIAQDARREGVKISDIECYELFKDRKDFSEAEALFEVLNDFYTFNKCSLTASDQAVHDFKKTYQKPFNETRARDFLIGTFSGKCVSKCEALEELKQWVCA